ncbi:hypothetical protein DLAC_04046 [Tieghemostelium lacteum]|uniref:Carrier domain-containing protein n=1 Tax=Tieghemostelium lacteum TaxID=361077 RepID=A0A151ZRZ2_TIELA|nr:hypothetical protein DLAC_04046 [Tieghemostelium lacteum]|eukprot:KYQ96747.1 hypothetical protein DLAC_04046 [Tieghemostelium lacteum]
MSIVKEIREQEVFDCKGCNCEIRENFAIRYTCAECEAYNLCLECHSKEECYFQNLENPGSNPMVLPENYKPPVHTDKAPLPHYMTLETKSINQSILDNADESAYQSMKNSFERFKNRRCLGWRQRVPASKEYPYGLGAYQWLKFGQVHQLSMNFACGLSHYTQPGNRIAIYMDNCFEWYIGDFAALWASLPIVPIHHTSSYSNLFEIIENSESNLLVCSKTTVVNLLKLFEDPTLTKKLEKILKLIVIRESDYDKESFKIVPNGIEVKSYQEILEFGEISQPAYTFGPNKPTDIVSITYTSGSTGTPKGVVNCDRNFNYFLSASHTNRIPYPWVLASFATLAHIQRVLNWISFYQGGCVGIYSGSYDTMFEDFRELRPHYLWSVPRLWNVLLAQFQSNLSELTLANNQLDVTLRKPTEELKSMVQKQIFHILGDRLTLAATGGAPCSDELMKFLKFCWPKSEVADMYGSTESIIIMYNERIFDEVQFKLDPVPEFNYTPDDKPYPRGELLVKADSMSCGYYKNEVLTAISFADGWYRTGDIVELYGPRNIRIIDRRKSAFKLANGEFVTPDPLQAIYLSSKMIRQIFIYGHSSKQFLVAILTPSDVLLEKVRSDPKYSEDLELEMCRIFLIQELNNIAKEKNLPDYEIPKVIEIDKTVWSIDNGLVTSSGKFNRNTLATHYEKQINEMYSKIEKIQLELRQLDKKDVIQHYIRLVLNIDPSLDIDISKLSFSQIGGDSLGAVKLSNLLKDQQNIDISPSMILNQNVNLTNLTKVLENSDHNLNELVKVDWSREFELEDDIVPSKDSVLRSKPIIEKQHGNDILLTGCTGYLGLNILANLLNLSGDGGYVGKIYCLVRNVDSEEKALENLLNLLKKQQLKVDEKVFRSCAIPLLGDLSKPLIGLTPERFSQLTDQIDIILHNGAIVNMVLPYQNMKATNVQSTKDLLKLAVSSSSTRGTMKFVYISTVAVFLSGDLNKDFTEDTLPTIENISNSSGYNQSKLVSDVLVREAANRGLPVMVFRPGTIYCHTKTGVDNPYDFVGLIIKSILQTKTYPKLLPGQGGVFNLSPVDWVSDSIVSLMLSNQYWTTHKNSTPIFHMVNNNLLHMDILCEYIQSVVPLQQIPLTEWISLQFSQKQNLLEPVQHLFVSNDRFPGFDLFKGPKTNIYLSQIGKEKCSTITQDLVAKNIKYLIKANFIEQ